MLLLRSSCKAFSIAGRTRLQKARAIPRGSTQEVTLVSLSDQRATHKVILPNKFTLERDPLTFKTTLMNSEGKSAKQGRAKSLLEACLSFALLKQKLKFQLNPTIRSSSNNRCNPARMEPVCLICPGRQQNPAKAVFRFVGFYFFDRGS